MRGGWKGNGTHRGHDGRYNLALPSSLTPTSLARGEQAALDTVLLRSRDGGSRMDRGGSWGCGRWEEQGFIPLLLTLSPHLHPAPACLRGPSRSLLFLSETSKRKSHFLAPCGLAALGAQLAKAFSLKALAMESAVGSSPRSIGSGHH